MSFHHLQVWKNTIAFYMLIYYPENLLNILTNSSRLLENSLWFSCCFWIETKNIINLISVLVIWRCPCAGGRCLLWTVHSFGKTLLSFALFHFLLQVYAPTSNAEEAEVEQLFEDLQDLQELTPPKDVLFIIGD